MEASRKIPEGFEELVRAINQSHHEAGNNSMQELVITNCMKYLRINHWGRHWFCDPYMFPISTHALTLFSYPKNDVLESIKPKMESSIRNCEDCLIHYTRGKSQLKWNFINDRKINLNTVELFMNLIYEWEVSFLLPTLQPLADIIFDKEEIIINEQLDETILICLYNPAVLRSSSTLRNCFTTVTNYLVSHKKSPLPLKLLPGLFYLSFEGTHQGKSWANLWFKALITKKYLATNDMIEEFIVEEFCIHLYRIEDQKFYTKQNSILFWNVVEQLIEILDNEAFKRFNTLRDADIVGRARNIRLYPPMRLLLNYIMSFEVVSIPQLFRVFNSLLERFGQEFWQFTGQLQFKQILDNTLINDEYRTLLTTSPTEINDIDEWTLQEITRWFYTILSTIPPNQVISTTIRIVTFLFKNSINNTTNTQSTLASDIRNQRESILRTIAINVLSYSFDNFEIGDFRHEDFSLNLLKVREIRAVIDTYCDPIIIETIRNSGKSANLGSTLISNCFKYDLALLAHNTYLFSQNITPTSFDIFPLLWDSFVSTRFFTNYDISIKMIKSLREIGWITKFTSSKNDGLDKHYLNARIHHNENVLRIFEPVKQLLNRLTLANQSMVRTMFSDSQVLRSIWACTFNPLVNQAATEVFYHVSDMGVGRLEAIQQLLGTYLKENIDAIQINITCLISLRNYEPCPKGVRIIMDILKALMDPSLGVLVTNSESVKYQKEVIQLWKNFWYFLSMIFKRTFEWATTYHLEELLEFTRDVLDCSHLLLDSYRFIISGIDQSEWEELFQVFMGSASNAVFWLRLGDPTLLNSCLELMIRAFNLAKELKFTVDDKFIESCTKFGTKYKKFNNKLNEQQRNDILSVTRAFSPEIVERIELETKLSRSRTATPSREVIEMVSDDESKPSQSQSQSTKPRSQLKQQTLGKFVEMTKEVPVAPEPKKFKSGSLEAIRKDLQSSRSPIIPIKKPISTVTPAPPRPAGFNSKRQQVAPPVVSIGRSLNSLKHRNNNNNNNKSDSSDSELDVDTSDLFYTKKKKVIEIDMKGQPVVKEKVKIDLAKKEEERMRARLNVSLKPLYSTILRWNYTSNDQYPTSDISIYQETKSEYDNAKEYVKAIEPLYMLELWSQIQSVKNTTVETPFEILVGSRTTVDGFFDIYASVKKSILADRKVGESDLLVLGFVKDSPNKNELGRYLKSPTSKTCLAKVREIKSANAEYFDITIRVYPSGPMVGVLTPQSQILAMKVMQMITAEREYTSLKGLEYYDLYDDIIRAEPGPVIPISDTEATKAMKTYDLNMSQAKAVLGTYNSRGFSLIQGPPGTGKTKTILGIVGYSLSKSYKENVINIPDSKAPGTPATPTKILVCAPSNAAVDELVLRLRSGVFNADGQHFSPKVVRLGRSDVINAAVRDLTLEEQTDKELQARSLDITIDTNLRPNLVKCSEEIKRIELKMQEEGTDLGEAEVAKLEEEFHTLRRQRNQLARQLDEQREKSSKVHRAREYERRVIQAKILNGAQIICATLSGSAVEMLANLGIKFEQVIIDEACQCVELSAIIPLRYGCKKCIMVGDPNQLPPTVISKAAADLHYDQSLFVRIQQNHPNSIYLLDVQYRMHPNISAFPSREFYNSKLHDGEGMLEKNNRPWHEIPQLSAYQLFNISGKHERNELSRSLFNQTEARVTLELVEKLMNMMPEGEFAGRIGIISPYKEQIKVIKDIFVRKYGKLIFSQIDFNTVDGFQGQEKEIIIMSCVRASETGNVGFLSDIRRMNVALTRARTTLWILGNIESLSRNGVWKRLIEDAKSRSSVIEARPGFLASLPKRKIEVDQTANKKHKSDKQSSKKKPEPKKPEPKVSSVFNYERLPDKSYGRTDGVSAGATPTPTHTPTPIAATAPVTKILPKPTTTSLAPKPTPNSLNRPTPNSLKPKPKSKVYIANVPPQTQTQSQTQSNVPRPSKSGVLPGSRVGTPVVEDNSTSTSTSNGKGSQPTPSNSGYLPSNGKPVVPSNSGTVRPPKPSSSIFIQRKRPRK
ncbi:DEAD-box type RNA helicase [Scheffersomyces amazonensis]|uniref:DEAD-box type RNA helicase n=1 Tax=Scheffersomyces amazonensis TaxID=1078765 RepID=UPI00315D295B